MCKWFIGLVFHTTQTANIDLTYDIQSFSDAGEYWFYHYFRHITEIWLEVYYNRQCSKHCSNILQETLLNYVSNDFSNVLSTL
jgi:hypothetical protein